MTTPSGTQNGLLIVERMPGQRQVRKQNDDWAGIIDQKKRKQLQNRLNQRAWRQRRAATKRSQTDKAGPGEPMPLATFVLGIPSTIDGAADNSSPLSPYLSQVTHNVLTSDGASTHQASHNSYVRGNLASPTGSLDSIIAEPAYSAVMLLVHPAQRGRAHDFILSARANHFHRVAVPRQLPLLIKINVMAALAHNATLLGISPEYLCDEGAMSPFSRPPSSLLPSSGEDRVPSSTSSTDPNAQCIGIIADEEEPESDNQKQQRQQEKHSRSICPASLLPTATQRAVPHHPWIDLLPFAAMRDRLLLEMEAGTIDEDELCADMLEEPEVTGTAAGGGNSGRANGSPPDAATDMEEQYGVGGSGDEQPAALVIWGDASDPTAWEATLPFLRKYWSLAAVSPTLLEATNRWRARRGEVLIRW